MTVSVNWEHPLLDGALDVIWSGAGTLVSYGTPSTTETALGLDALNGGTNGGYLLQDYVPNFADYSGDMTITFVAIANNDSIGSIAGYDYYSGNYANFAISLNRRRAGGYAQRGCFDIAFMPSRSGYADGVSIGSDYLADTTAMPFYNAGEMSCVSAAFVGASASDLRVVIDGATSGLSFTRTTAIPTTNAAPAYDGFGLGGYFTASSNTFASANAGGIVLIIVHGRKLSEAEQIDLTSDPTQVLLGLGGASASFTITSEDATFSGGAKVSPMTSFTVTASDSIFSGGASAGASSASFALTTGNSTFSGGSVGNTTQGTITTPALKNNTGTVLSSQTGITAYAYTPSTGALVVKLTGQATDGSGVMTLTDALIVAGTQYRVVIVLGSGAEGMDKLTAS